MIGLLAMVLTTNVPIGTVLAEWTRPNGLRFQRVRVNLLGRYMLADRREFPCQVSNMSPGGMALIAPVSGQPGESTGPLPLPLSPPPLRSEPSS